jgi:hypothetical protein
MFNKIKDWFKWIFYELPKLVIKYILLFKTFIRTFKTQFPIIFGMLAFYYIGIKIIKDIFDLNWIIVLIIDHLFKLAVSIYINYSIVQNNCKDNPNVKTTNLINRILIDSIIVLLTVILTNLTLRFIPFIRFLYRIIRKIPFVGLPFIITSIFLLESFIYTHSVEKPSDYCTSTDTSDIKKLIEKYKNFIIGKLPLIIMFLFVTLIRYYIRNKLTPRQFTYYYGDDEDEDDY